MTPFEIIILILIYCFCFGYLLELLKIGNEDRWDIAIRIVGSAIGALCAPIILVVIGIHIANKLNNL